MIARPLGDTGINVSALGLGLVKIGRNQGIDDPNYADHFKLPDDKTVKQLLAKAAELGINLLDTAPAYGTSEQRLGDLFRTQIRERRSHWVLCSKAGEEFSDGESRFDFTASAMTASVERSLRRLGTDYLDVVLVHSNGEDEQLLEQYRPLQTLAKLRDQGKIRAIGFSGKSLKGGRLALTQGAQVLMVTLNSNQREELPLLSEAHAAGCGILIKKAMARGYGKAADLSATATLTGVSSIISGTLNPTHLAANARIVREALVAAR